MATDVKSTGSSKELFRIAGTQLGDGKVLFAWQPDGNYLAVVGTNRRVEIYDRYGQVLDDVVLTAGGNVIGIDWDKDGEMLAIMQNGNSAIICWDATTRKSSFVETNMKDLVWLKWSKTSFDLALGSGKGNLIIYNKRTSKLNPLLGKHSKRIFQGAWSVENQLVLLSEDKTFSVNSNTGQAIRQEVLRGEPSEVFLGEVMSAKDDSSTMVSILIAKKTVFVCSLIKDARQSFDFSFPLKYGDILVHRWYHDNAFIVGFSSGMVLAKEPNVKDSMLFTSQMFQVGVSCIDISPSMQRAAICGGNVVKFIDLKEWKEVTGEALQFNVYCDQVAWTADGNFLTVSLSDGTVVNFLASMPVMNAAHGSSYAYMSSLREMRVEDALDESGRKSARIEIKNEPDFVAVGKRHVGLGKNNVCWLYTCDKQGQLLREVDYLASVEAMSLNRDMVAVLYDGQVNLQKIIGDEEGKFTRSFPESSDESQITCMQLTDDFLVYSTVQGTLVYFSLEDQTRSSDFRHTQGIKFFCSNKLGTRLVVVDSSLKGFIHNPVESTMLEIPDFPTKTSRVLWDVKEDGVFAAVADSSIVTYKLFPATLKGPRVDKVGQTESPRYFSPMLLIDGVLTHQTRMGSIARLVLDSHSSLNPDNLLASSAAKFAQSLALGRLTEAFQHAMALGERSKWEELYSSALQLFQIKVAFNVSRYLEDCANVMALEQLSRHEDKLLLAGEIALLMKDDSLAQELYLSSSSPIHALDMRCDLRQWDRAMRLAETLAPTRIPHICLQFAEQLQTQGEYEAAHMRYEQASQERFSVAGRDVEVRLSEEHKTACRVGIAKMELRMGNVTKGVQLAIECGESVCAECAKILADMKQLGEAALLYEKGKMYERAVSLYISIKDFKAAQALMPLVHTPKLHVRFGQAKEKLGQYREAADAYERGKEMDEVVRLCLQHLSQPQRAFTIVRETRTTKGAMECANHCQANADFRGALEFLLIAKEKEKAFELAQAHELIDALALFLGSSGTRGEYLTMARYYQSKQQLEAAGDFFDKANDHKEALRMYLQVGEKALDKAIAVVGAARNEVLTHTLIDYLMGEHDRIPKDPNYIFRLYMALGSYRQAARTAVIIARQEQELGNYKVAHKMLFDTYQDLQGQGIPVPRELQDSLLLLHSYVLVKVLVKQGDHEAGARMLVRVSNSISKFPAHVVPILTSTVIECQRGGLRKTSFEFASMLMRPEYRAQVADAYRKKIETIVRKPSKGEEEEPVSPCPYCAFASPTSALECPQCRNRLPYCILSGVKMVASDWSSCPSCHFPALHSRLLRHLQADPVCPMCENEIDAAAVVKVDNPEEHLKALLHNTEEEEENSANKQQK